MRLTILIGGLVAAACVALFASFIVEPVANSASLSEIAAPEVSAVGTSRVFMDSTTHVVNVSQNGAAAQPLVLGNAAALTNDRTASGIRTASTIVATSVATAPSSGQVLTATSSTAATWQAPAGGNDARFSLVKKTAGQTFNSATPANVTDLVFAVTNGRYYSFRFVLLVRSDTSTVGVGTTLTTPSFTTFGATARTMIAADGAGGEFQGAITASGDAVLPTAVPAINTDYVLIIEGNILPSADGNLQVQARTETGTTVVTVRQGSVGFLTDFGT